MKLTKCGNGHFYDSDKYPECPYCNTDLLRDRSIVRTGEAEQPAAVETAAPAGPVTGWLVVLDGPAKGRDLRLGVGRSFLGLDADGTPVTLSADAPLSARRAVLVYDEEKSAFTLPARLVAGAVLSGRGRRAHASAAHRRRDAAHGRCSDEICAVLRRGVPLVRGRAMTSEIVILITELRNKQRITLPAGSYRFGRSAQCEYVLRRNNVGDHQFTVSFANGQWGVTDGGSDYRTWYNNRYLEPGETSILQSGDVIGLNTDGDADTQEITFRVEEITSVQGDGMAPKKEQTTDAVLRETDIRRKRRVLIGRGDDCDIKLVNDRVSRHHCEILYKDGHYELHDLGSTNGTYVDGVRVTRTVLRNGAVINVPAQVFAFTGGMLHYHAHQSGISIQLVNVYKRLKMPTPVSR